MYLVMNPLYVDDKSFEEQENEDAKIMVLLWNSTEFYVTSNVTFLKTSKKIWEATRKMYYAKSNLTICMIQFLAFLKLGKEKSHHKSIILYQSVCLMG